jgi:hypothetical protein
VYRRRRTVAAARINETAGKGQRFQDNLSARLNAPAKMGACPVRNIASASLRADAGDAIACLLAFAVRLEGALSGQMWIEVERHGGLSSQEKQVGRNALDLGEQRYSIAEEDNGALHAERVKVLCGIALKTDGLGVDDWIAAPATRRWYW